MNNEAQVEVQIEVQDGGGYGAWSYPPAMLTMREWAIVTWQPRWIQICQIPAISLR